MLAAILLRSSSALAAPWMQPGYLYRYFVWGARRIISSRSDDYRNYASHPIDSAPTAFHFAPGNRDEIPASVSTTMANS